MKISKIVALMLVALLLATVCFAAKNPGKLSAQPGQGNATWWGHGPKAATLAQGPVTHVDANSIAVQTKMRGEIQFAVNDKTRVRVLGKPAKITDIKQGDRVIVKFKPVQNGTPLALGVAIPNDKQEITGEIESVQGGVVTVKTKAGSVPVTVTNQTRIVSHGYEGAIADLLVGYKVVVGGDPIAARRIEFVPTLAKGAVTEVNGNTITIKTIKQQVIQLQAGDKTAVLVRPRVGPNVKGTIADVKVGSPVNIGFHANSGGEAALLWIDVLTGM